MILRSLVLQHFRSYAMQSFSFDKETTFIVGPNTAGKTNVMEGIFLLSTGKSNRAEKDYFMIKNGQEQGRVKGKIEGANTEILEVVLTAPHDDEVRSHTKRFLVNDVPKRRVDFAGILPVVLFTPADLEIIIDSPSVRRQFLDTVLEPIDSEYRYALLNYTKALRQRNALLEVAQETGSRDEKQFSYWDDLLITNGQLVTKKREEFTNYINTNEKELMSFHINYDKSVISKERLLQYKDAELHTGITLVGPHRDDFSVALLLNGMKRDIRSFGSRGQQRLVVLQLKLFQLSYMETKMHGDRPLLLLDDIFSELDSNHIALVLRETGKQQTIITTTHEEFLPEKKETIIDLTKL